MPRAHRWVTAVLLGSLLVSSRALADPLGCERGIARASAKYVQGRAKVISKCEDGKTKGKVRDTIVCATDPLFDPARLAVTTRLFATINLACGGPNLDCGDADDEPLGATPWGSVTQCPDFGGTGCTNPIATCVDISQCLGCMHDAAVGQALNLSYGAFDADEFGSNSAVNRCQRAIGKATAKYLASRSKALHKCWDARLLGRHANVCPSPGDGRAAQRISVAEAKKRKAICKACGGPDALCDGAGDLALSAIGFASSCPAVTPLFPPASCGGAIGDTTALVDCVDCVTDFDVDCAGAASVPGIVGPLPAACNAGASTTTSSSSLPSTSSTSTSSSSTSSSPSSSSSTIAGSTSTSEPTTSSTSSTTVTTTSSSSTTTSGGGGPSGFDFLATAGSGSCGNTYRDLGGVTPLKNLLCGQLSLGGGISQVPDNATPSGATNRFGLSCAGPACTVGPASPATAAYDCTDTGCLFGTPLPISNAGLSVCVTNTFSLPVSGTMDIGTGDTTLNLQLNSATVLTGNPAQPCPICAVSVGGAPCVGSVGSPCTGVCDGSPNQGAACTTKNPNGLTNACPAPASVAGVGGQRCYRGANNNLVCSTGADCPGGLCSQFIGNIPISLNPLTTGTASLSNAGGLFCAGQTATQKGAFKSDICLSGANSGKPCTAATAVADCGAGVSCRAGTLTNYCNGGANDGLGCSNATTCPSPGTCVRAGTLVQLVREIGTPTGALSVGVPAPIKLGAAFCVVATTNPTVNSNANLPGPGATSVVGTVTLVP